MTNVLTGLSVFSTISWKLFMGTLRFFAPSAAVTRYLDEEVTAHQRELEDVNNSQIEAVARLKPQDQVLMFFSGLPLTQARAAKRRYWKEENPYIFYKLYTKLKYTPEEAEVIMRDHEKMPGYFRKKVLALMNA